MKRKRITLFIDVGLIALVFLVIFTIPVFIGSLSKNEDKKIENNSTVDEDTVNNNIEENINKPKLTDSGVDLKNVKVYRSDTGKVETIPLEEYVLGVVLSEMPAAFEEEALMAQSVLARTYVMSKKFSPCSKSNEGDICDTTHCQVYTDPEEKKASWGSKGDEYYNKIRNAVKETEGLVVSYEQTLIKYPQYFAISSGKTEEAASVFSIDIPYLQSVESPGEEDAPKYESSEVYSKSEFLNKIKNSLGGSGLTLNNFYE